MDQSGCHPLLGWQRLEVDSPQPAGLNYPIIETNGHTNLTLDSGTLLFWFKPNWSSTNLDGGTGPTDWGRLVDAGLYTTNASYGWWSLYFDPSGTSLNFSSQTHNGAQATYLSSPIAWSADTWHFIALAYSSTNSALYLDGELAASGSGVLYQPGPQVRTNGFYLGSDYTGWAQAHGQFENLKTWNYPLSSNAINFYYTVYATNLTSFTPGLSLNPDLEAYAESGPPLPGGGSSTNNPPTQNDLTNTIPSTVYGTNDFWLEILPYGTNSITQDTNSLALILHGTTSDIAYQILSKPGLTDTVWTVEQNLLGAANQNWTPTTVSMSGRPSLFLKALAYTLDTDGDGLPDWWETQYGLDPNNPDTGNTGTPDGYKQDTAGDGWTNLQKYQMGVAPNVSTTPPTPQGVQVFYNPTNNMIYVSWAPSPGPVTGYTVELYIPELSETFDYAVSGTSLVTSLPAPATINPIYFLPELSVQANYTNYEGGDSAWDGPHSLLNSKLNAPVTMVRGAQGTNYFIFPALPGAVTSFVVTRVDEDVDLDGWWNDITVFEETSITNISNGVYPIPAAWLPQPGHVSQWKVQFREANGSLSDYNSAGLNHLPFYDGRRALKQNMAFLLRAANSVGPFNFVTRDTWESGYFNYIWPVGYAYQGFEYLSEDGGRFSGDVKEVKPFADNCHYRNFVVTANDLDSSGALNTGLTYNGDTLVLPNDPANNDVAKYLLDTSDFISRNGTNFTPLLSMATNSMWTYAVWPWADFLDTDINGPVSPYLMPANRSNYFGLTYLSAVATRASANGAQMATVSPGNPLSGSYSQFFPETAVPQFQTIGYYFGRPDIQDLAEYADPLPGHSGFSPSNASSLLIAPVGLPFRVTAWAKQIITNGNTNLPVYVEQYFDKAYKIDANGNVTTNETGILSPYGEFFPTEPGRVALVTMADIDNTNQRGTGVVNVIKLQLDVNHDGNMDLSFAGPDNTSADRPFRFWVNNDYDRLHDVDGGREPDDLLSAGCPYTPRIPTPDCEYRNSLGDRIIPCLRDLEDFARLWLSGISTNLFTNLPPDVTAELSWGDKGNPNTNNPTIDIFGTADPDGGIGYLTNYFAALQQTNKSHYGDRLGPGDSIPVVYTNSSGWQAWNRAIWCGVKAGAGALTLTFKRGTNKIAECSAYIEVKDIKQMYERWTVGDEEELAPTSVPYRATEDLPGEVAPFKYGQSDNTNTPYILLVPDYDLPTWKKDRYAETTLKRLYWQGYEGRFGLFRWPGVTNTFHSLDDSEFKSWQSGAGLLSLLNQLNSQYPGSVYLMAHGYGAFAAGEALRLSGTNTVVNTYIAMQGAVPSHAYDPFTPFRSLGSSDSGTPDRYWAYYTNSAPPYFSGVGGASVYINYFNTNDSVLTNFWRETENSKPDIGYHWDGTNFSSGLLFPTPLLFPVDTYKIFSYCDEARCDAIGAQPNLGGPFLSLRQVDLTTLNVNGVYVDHSGQFKSFCADDWAFWYAVLKSMRLKQ